MNNIKTALKSFGVDDWVLALCGVFAVVVGVLDFIGLLQLRVEQLLQMIIIGVGLLMAAVIVDANRQKAGLKELGSDLEKSVQGRLAVTKIDRVELGVEYAANRVRMARYSIDHASLSPPVPRWHSSVSRFEKATREAAFANQIKIRYIANFEDEVRLQRVRDILKDPNVNRYFVKFFNPPNLAHLLNFLIFDEEEVLLIMSGFGEETIFLAIRNEDIVSTFKLILQPALAYGDAL